MQTMQMKAIVGTVTPSHTIIISRQSLPLEAKRDGQILSDSVHLHDLVGNNLPKSVMSLKNFTC